MIVVVGRPHLAADGAAAGSAGLIALAAARAGGRVELVGSVGNDADGDAVITALGRERIGHAAMLRDPAGITPRGTLDEAVGQNAPPPRLDAADLDLGLSYLAECQVLVLSEPLPVDVVRVAADAAAYHGAALVVLSDASDDPLVPSLDLPEAATLLAIPEEDDGAFPDLVGRYAAKLDEGLAPADAWQQAVDESGWEKSTE